MPLQNLDWHDQCICREVIVDHSMKDLRTQLPCSFLLRMMMTWTVQSSEAEAKSG